MASQLYSVVDTDELIRLVHQRKALWDRGDLAHFNLNALNKLGEEVAQE
jgi:hypothetical protein